MGGHAVNPGELVIFEPSFVFGQVAVKMPLDEHVYIVVCRYPHLQVLADELGLLQHHVAQLKCGSGADELIERTFVTPALGIREHVAQ